MIRRTGMAGLCVVGAVLLSACSPDSTQESPTTSQPVGTSAAPSDMEPTTSAPEDATQTTTAPFAYEDQGQERAGEAVVEFWEVVDRLSQDPEVPVQKLAGVARGQAVAQWVSNIQARRDADLVQTGETKVTVTDVQTIQDDQRYEVTACLDWSDVLANGVKPDRGDLGDRQQITYVVRPDATSEGELFVTDDPLEYEPCEP